MSRPLATVAWTDLDEPARARVREIYGASFPEELTAPFEDLLVDRMLGLVSPEEGVVGLALVRDLGRGEADTGWTFLRYFAAGPRGRGVGSAMLAALADTLRGEGRSVLLWDVEDPDEPGIGEESVTEHRRRIAFYERAGGRLLDVPWWRPPHEDGHEPHLRLMALPLGADPLPGLADLVRGVLLHRYGCGADHQATIRTLESLTLDRP